MGQAAMATMASMATLARRVRAPPRAPSESPPWEVSDNSLFPAKEPCLSLEDELLKQRLARIREIEALGYRAYGRRYDFSHTVPDILAEYGAKTAEELEPHVHVRVAGRVMTLRHMGKAGFAHLQQNGER